MHGHAELVVLPLGHMQALTLAKAGIDAVGLTARRTVVARTHDDAVLDDDGTIAAAQAGGPPPYGLGYIEKILRPVGTRLFSSSHVAVSFAQGNA